METPHDADEPRTTSTPGKTPSPSKTSGTPKTSTAPKSSGSVDAFPDGRRRAVPADVVHPPILYRAPTSTVDCPRPARAMITLFRSEIELSTGRRLALGEVVGRMVDFAGENRDDFLRFCEEP